MKKGTAEEFTSLARTFIRPGEDFTQKTAVVSPLKYLRFGPVSHIFISVNYNTNSYSLIFVSTTINLQFLSSIYQLYYSRETRFKVALQQALCSRPAIHAPFSNILDSYKRIVETGRDEAYRFVKTLVFHAIFCSQVPFHLAY